MTKTTANLTIWPLGYEGAVMTGVGRDTAAGCLFIIATPDGAFADANEAWQRSAEIGGPGTCLHFKDTEAVDALIAQLEEVKAAIVEQGT